MDTQTRIKPIERYYDLHPEEIEGVELSQTRIHLKSIDYLKAVLLWLYQGQDVAVVSEINLYINKSSFENDIVSQPTLNGNGNGNDSNKAKARRKRSQPAVPDIMVIDGWSEQDIYEQASYVIGEDGPPPRAVFEIASPKTWRRDLEYKQKFYERGGVPNYFVFDPNRPQAWDEEWRKKGRLVGWQLNEAGDYNELPMVNGQMWSKQLDSGLVVRNTDLQLYDAQSQLRLTSTEYERQRAEGEHQRAEDTIRYAEYEHQRAEDERRRTEDERRRTEDERRRADKLEELLRRYVQNPEDLL